MAMPERPPNRTWSSGGILMSASPAKRGEALRRVTRMNQTAPIHDMFLVIKVSGVWPNGDHLCQAFFLGSGLPYCIWKDLTRECPAAPRLRFSLVAPGTGPHSWHNA